MPFCKLFFHAKIMLCKKPFQVIKNTSNTGILTIVPHGLTVGKLRSLLISQVKICVYVHIWLFLGSSVVLGLRRVHEPKIIKKNPSSYFSHGLPS